MTDKSNTTSLEKSSSTGDNSTGDMEAGCHYGLWSEDSALTWEQLVEVERSRREILQKVEQPVQVILNSWTGTCVRELAFDWMIWGTMSIFIAIRVVAHTTNVIPEIADNVQSTNISVLGGFLSFLLVLFVNQTNTRFFSMYLLAKQCATQIQDVTGLLSSSPQCPPAMRERFVRYMNAAHIAGYVGLGGPYTKSNFFDHFNKQYNLLTASEMARVEKMDMNSGSAAFKLLVTWCSQNIGYAQKEGYIDSVVTSQLYIRTFDFREAMDGIYDYCDQPTHFFYIHFLCLLSVLYLPLFAANNAFACGWGENADWSQGVLNGLIVLLQAFFVVGLRMLAQKMSDPFGPDIEDLSVLTYVTATIENSRIILDTQHPTDDNSSIALDPLLPPVDKNLGLQQPPEKSDTVQDPVASAESLADAN